MNYDIEQILIAGDITVSLPPGSTDYVLLAEAEAEIGGLVRRTGNSNNYPTNNELMSLYYSLKTKTEKIRSYLDQGLQVYINYKNDKGETVQAAFISNDADQLESLDNFIACVRRWFPARLATEAEMINQMSSYDHPSMGRIPKTSAYSTQEVISAANDIITSAMRANEAMLGQQEVSMQIGYIEFAEDELGPDSVFITEINDVSTIASLRSKTDVAIKGSAGRSSIEVDIIFKDKDQINTKFRELLAMLKMAPIIPLGGSVFAAAIINRITASGVFEKFKKHFYSQDSLAGRKLEELISGELRANSDPSTGLTESLLKDIIKLDRSALEYIVKKSETSPAQDARTVTDNAGARDVNTEELIPDSLRTLLVSVVFDSMSVSTIAAMPGAIRVRLSFMRHHDITSDNGDLMFIDQDGNSTYDIRRCQPLKDAVKIVYLSPTRRRILASNKNENEADATSVNPEYISQIGDKTIVETVGKTVSGNLSGIDVSRVHTSEMGHNLYQDVVSGELSPILFKFSTNNGQGSIVEYVPWRMINSSINWTIQNKIALIPMQGQLMPAVQMMGRGGITGTMTFMTNSRSAVQEFMTVKASIDEISTSKNLGQLLRREFVDIYNDVLNLSGAVRFILSSATIQTSPDNPNLFMITVDFVSNEETPEKTEKLTVVQSTKSSVNELEELWWWMYGALVYNYEQSNKLEPGSLLREISGDVYGPSSMQASDPGKYVSGIGRKILKKPTSIRGSFSDSVASNKDNNLYTLQEIKLVLDMLRGFNVRNIDPMLFEGDSVVQSGLVERNLLVAAVTEIVRLGRIGPAINKSITYSNASDTSDITGTIRAFISDRIVKLSNLCENASNIGSFDDGLDGPDMFMKVFQAIESEGQLQDPMIIFDKSTTYDSTDKRRDYAIDLGSNSARGGEAVVGISDTTAYPYNRDFYYSVVADMRTLPTQTSDSRVHNSLIKEMGYRWIPTPALWQMMFNVMVAPGKFRTRRAGDDAVYRGFPAGIHYPRTKLSTYLPGVGLAQGPIYYISKVWQSNKTRLNILLNSPEARNRLPSYFADPRRAELYQQIGRAGFSLDEASKYNFLVDPEIFEKRNTYTDLGLPRYSELFSINKDDPDPKPRKTPDGFEIWRKVAPTYAELGEPANIFRALTGLVHSNGKYKFTHPSLITPRVFQDYCDPGFFYHKRTWINDSYAGLLDEIRLGTTEDTRFMPSGPGGAFTPGFEEIAKMRIKHQDEKIPKIIASDFDILAATEAQAAAQKDGVRTVNELQETNRNDGRVSEMIVKAVKESLENNAQNPLSGIPSLIEKERQNSGDNENRYLVVDAQGATVGMLVVNKKGEQTGSNSNIERIRTNAKGQNEINIPTSDSSKNSIFNGDEFKGKSIKFIDMTSEFNKPADTKAYMSSTEMIKYNEYSKQDSAAVLKRTLEGIGDQKINKARNYPAFRVYFVREKVMERGDSLQFMSDDIYGYASVLSMDVMHDKEDASTAVISLTDITGVLSSSLFRRQIIKDNYSIKEGRLVSGSGETRETNFDPNNTPTPDNSDSDVPQKIILEVGTNIVVKMGYGQDPEFLRTIFTGAVAEIQPGDVTTIIAQSYRTEMFKYINFYGSNGLISSMISGGFSDVKNWTHPLFLVHHILVKMAKVSGVESALSFSGLPHFGRFMTMADFLGLSDRDKQEFSNEYNKEANRTVPRGSGELTEQERAAGVNNDIDASNPGNLTKGAVFAGAAYAALAFFSGPVGWVTLLGTAAAGVYGAYQNRYKRYVAKYDDFHVYTNAMRNVMISESFETNFWTYVDQEWIADGSGWSCLKEVARYKVNHICSEVPYGNHATLFMGKPDNLYHYKPLDGKSLEYYQQMAPVMSKFVLDKLNENLLDPYLESIDFKDPTYFGGAVFDELGQYTYQAALTLELINRKIEAITVLKQSEKFDYVFTNKDFTNPEEFTCFVEATDIISLSSRALFPNLGTVEEPRAKTIDSVQFYNINNGLVSTDKDIEPQYFATMVFSGITADLFLGEGIMPDIKIDGVGASFKSLSFSSIFSEQSLDIMPMDRSEFESLGYSKGDLVAFERRGDSIRAVSKSKLLEIGISAKTGLPFKDAFIIESDYGNGAAKHYERLEEIRKASNGDQTTITNLKTISSYGSQLNGLAIYDKVGRGTLYHGGFKGIKQGQGGAKEIDFDFNIKNYLLISNEEPVISPISTNNINITLIQDKKSDLEFVEKATKSSNGSLVRTIFAYFFGLDYRTLENGATDLNKGIQNVRGSNSLYGDLDGFAVEFTRALMEGTEFCKRMEGYRTYGNVDPDFPGIDSITSTNERTLRFFNIKLERMCRSYLEDRGHSSGNKSITYGGIKARSVVFDEAKAKKVFTDNLIESVNQGYLTQPEIQSYINNSKALLEIASRDLKTDNAVYSSAEAAARNAVSVSSLRINQINPQVTGSDSDDFYKVVLRNANKYKLFIIYFAKFLRKNPEVSAQSIGISETLEWLSEGVPPDQKKFRDTHVVVSDIDIVYNNIVATTSQMYNNILLFGPKDIEVKQSSDSDDPNLSYYSVDEAETSWVPFPNFQTTGVDFNPYVSPENRKQLQVRERNAETLDMKAALLINHLAEGMRPMYRGNIKIIGKHIKPYDLVYIADKFNHMFGFIEVERVVQNFSSTEGWTTTITPHAYVVPIDEVQMVARRFDTKWLEYMFLGLRVIDTALNVWALWSLVAAPIRAGVSGALKAAAASSVDAKVAAEFGTKLAAAGADPSKIVKNTLVNMIAGGLLRKEAFMGPFMAEAKSLLTAGGKAATEEQINKLAVQLLIKSSPDWMAKGEVLSAMGTTLVQNLFSVKSLYLWLGRDMVFDGLSSYANISTQCQISSTTMPIHVFALVKSSRVYSAGLDTKLSRFYNYSERLGYSMSNASANFMNTIDELFSLENDVSRERNVKLDIADAVANQPGG